MLSFLEVSWKLQQLYVFSTVTCPIVSYVLQVELCFTFPFIIAHCECKNKTFSAILKKLKVNFLLEAILFLGTNGF